MKDRPRIGTDNNVHRIEIFNGNYSPSGTRIGEFENPWTVLTPWDMRSFSTYPEALDHAREEAKQLAPVDPTPQHQESVTKGWAPLPDYEAVWQEKQELTR